MQRLAQASADGSGFVGSVYPPASGALAAAGEEGAALRSLESASADFATSPGPLHAAASSGLSSGGGSGGGKAGAGTGRDVSPWGGGEQEQNHSGGGGAGKEQRQSKAQRSAATAAASALLS